jgi:hypothetical protein
MRYIQHKAGQKLHLAFEIEGKLTHPICGRKFNNYRMSINVPLGNSCKKCGQRLNNKNFNMVEFIRLNLPKNLF